MLSATDRVMILTAPYCPLYLWRTMRTREHPPLPIVFPSCQWPMKVLRLLLDAVVDVVEMAELRLESRPSLVIWEIRLCCGDSGRSLLRTARVPLGSRDSLCGRLGFEDWLLACLVVCWCRWETGGVFVPFLSSLRGCRRVEGRLALLRWRSAIGALVESEVGLHAGECEYEMR